MKSKSSAAVRERELPLPVQMVIMAILGLIVSAVLWSPAVFLTALNYSLGGNAKIDSAFQTTSYNTLHSAGLVANAAFIVAIAGSLVAAISVSVWWRNHKRKSAPRGKGKNPSTPRVAVGVMIVAVCADVLAFIWS